MVKRYSQLSNFCLALLDLAVVAASWGLAYQIRFLFPQKNEFPTRDDLLVNLLLALVAFTLVMLGFGVYRPKRDKSFLLEIGQLLRVCLLTWGILLGLIYYTAKGPFSRGMLAAFLPTLMCMLILERGLFRAFLRYIRRHGWNLRHALIVGTGRLGQSTMLKLKSNSWTGIRVVGFVDAHATAESETVHNLPVLGTIGDIQDIVLKTGVDCVFIALPSKHGERLHEAMAHLEQTSVDVRIVPDLYLSRFPINMQVGDLDGLPILSFREDPFAGWPGLYKRAFDIVGAAFGVLVFGLPMVVIAIAIKMTSPGAILYRQERVSFGGRPFKMLKFRTMVMDAEGGGAAFASKDDPRCTRIGKWLRSVSLDELPQLFNVLVGDMSLVGPRPERPEMLAKIRTEIPGFPLRLKVRAGLTGWAQVNGFRGRTSFRKRLQYDLYYLNNWSPLFDVRIVVATVFKGFRHPNAY